jgi:predicted dehydrogenase
MMRQVRVGVIGVGHLGQAHARILAALPEAQLIGVVDTNNARAEEIATRHCVRVFDHHLDLAANVDAVCVVTPTVFHHPVAVDLLRRGLAVLIEKPLALNLVEADELASLTERHGAILQVGHIERFNPAYLELRRRPITPKFIEVERHGIFTGRSTDIGAVLDLMIHDLDLLLDLIAEPVVEVRALGMTVFGKHEDMASARVRFAGGCIAHLTASRMSPNPKRKMRIWALEGYAGIDFCDKRLTLVQPSEELRERGLNARAIPPEARRELQEQVFTQHLQSHELSCASSEDQLTAELRDFVRCVSLGATPRVDAAAGRNAVALAERIVTSIREHAWTGDETGPIGPDELPLPAGALFDRPTLPAIDRAAA